MGASPVTPAEIAAVVPAATDTPCEKYEKLQQFAGLVSEYIAWELNSDGTLSEDFLDGIGVSTTGLAAPTGLSATDTSVTGITITWADVTGATSYRLYRGTTSVASEMTLLASDLTVAEYEDLVADADGPDADQVYWYRVVAYSTTSISPYSDPTSGKAPTSVTPGDPVVAVVEDTVEGVTEITIPAGYTAMELKMWGGGGNGGIISPWVAFGSSYRGGGGGSGAYIHVTGITVSSGQKFYLSPGNAKIGTADTYIYRGSAGASDYVMVQGGFTGGTAVTTAAPAGGAGGTLPSGANTTIGGTVVTGAGESSAGTTGTAGGGSGGAGAAGITRDGRTYGAGGQGALNSRELADTPGTEGLIRVGSYGRPGAIYYRLT